jgi:LPS export ABC transporter protein LptC
MSSSSVIKNTDSEKRNDSLRYHILAVVLLSAVVWFLLDTATNDEPLEISSLLQMSEQGYDYFMADVDSIHYTSDGSVDYRFQANRITHFPNPEFSLVESPRFLVFGEDDSNWEINSTKGRVEIDQETNQERLLLNEDVIIHGLSKDGRHINIFTHSLVIYPAEKNLRSDSDVTIESDGFVSSSKGFTADLNTNIVRQLSEGRMQYDN